ncbi:MAG: Nif3-like dinuclear metal center hexameric protein [Isosphaeraceae bacterium]
MTTVADLALWLESFAPARLAEAWDNVGLLWGDPSAAVKHVLTCLTVTLDVADEAIEAGAQAIVSHHPVLFRPIKTLQAGKGEGEILWRLSRANIAVLSPHTAFDNTVGGINDILAARLGLENVEPLRPSLGVARVKLIVFAPRADRERILAAAFGSGAGKIGLYDECSYSHPGFGTFFGKEGTNPSIGKPGARETVREDRIELLCHADRLASALAAIRHAHSYEEPAIDVIPLQTPLDGPGVGRLGRLKSLELLGDFAARVASALHSDSTRFVGPVDRPITRVAVACGAGDDFIADAARRGADLLLTGEARFHRMLEAESLGIALIVAGHFATERIGVESLADRLSQAYPDLTVFPSRRERDPSRPTA